MYDIWKTSSELTTLRDWSIGVCYCEGIWALIAIDCPKEANNEVGVQKEITGGTYRGSEPRTAYATALNKHAYKKIEKNHWRKIKWW